MDPNLIDTAVASPLTQDIMPPEMMADPAPVRSQVEMQKLGAALMATFQRYESDRRIAEMRYMKNLRQYLGVYDSEIDTQIPKDRSRAYPKLTRVKCVSMLSRLMNLLFSGGTKNWGCDASPVPNLAEEDMQTVLDNVMAEAQQSGQMPADEVIEAAIREFAKGRAKNLEIEIEDQLTEIGGARLVDYVALCRKVIMSGIIFGHGVLKGPFAKTRVQRRWQIGEQGPVPVEEEVLVPQFEFVPVWDYYPDMSAGYWHQMDGQFERVVMSREQVTKLEDNPDFFGDAIAKYLIDHKEGNYKAKTYESELKTLGPHINVTANDGRKYEILVWDGCISGHDLKACGLEVAESVLGRTQQAVVWVLDGIVIRANINPWSILGEDKIASYHHFVFEEEDASLLGEGLPQIMRDSQMGLCAAVRMALDNAGVVCGENLEVNLSLLRPDQDTTSVHAYKVWHRDDESPATINIPAVRPIPISSHIPELQSMAAMFNDFADKETFVSAATGGDLSKGPSEPFRTATGASMMKGDAALPFKDVVRNYDQFTFSVFSALIAFNKHFNMKPSIRGDSQPVALGSTSLIAKEVLGMAYDSLAVSLSPQEQLYINWKGLLKARLEVRDMPAKEIMVDDAEAKRREEGQAQAQAEQKQQTDEYTKAEIRKMLADAVKALTQADKNAAATDATTYTAVLTGLEKGVTPVEVAQARGGGGVPQGIIEAQRRLKPAAQRGGSRG